MENSTERGALTPQIGVEEQPVQLAGGGVGTGLVEELLEENGCGIREATRATMAPARLTILLSKSPHSPEHRKYLETVVGTAFFKFEKLFEDAGITIPTDNEILQQMIMTDRFSPEQIEALIRCIQTPGLIILLPQMQSFGDYRRLLHEKWKRGKQMYVGVSTNREVAFDSQDRLLQTVPTLCRFGIGEIVQELGKGEDGKLGRIISKWQKSKLAKVLRAPTPREYCLLQGQSTGLIDLTGLCILCEETEPHNIIGSLRLVSVGYGISSLSLESSRIGFTEVNQEDGCYNTGVRPVVVG